MTHHDIKCPRCGSKFLVVVGRYELRCMVCGYIFNSFSTAVVFRGVYVSQDKWVEVGRLVDEFYSRLVSSLSKESLRSRRSNLFYTALVGGAYQLSRLERSLVTMLGNYAPKFFTIFFEDVKELPPPFDFSGVIWGRKYWVKVVSGDEAFNKPTRDHVASESELYDNPIILTLQGEYFESVEVGRAVWLSAPSSWKFVTGESGAYKKFRDIVYAVAMKYRNKVWEVLKQE